MRARGYFLIPALVLPAAAVLFVRAGDIPALASVLPASVLGPSSNAPALPPAPASAPPAAKPADAVKSAAAPAPATGAEMTPASTTAEDPATLATLPAALIDDGSDDLPDLEPKDLDPVPPATPKRERPM